VVFPHTLAFNAPARREKTALILDALGLGAAADQASVLSAAHGFCERLGVEMRLSRLGVPEGDLPAMADEAHAIRRLLDNNPRDVGQDEILAMYRAAY
jgi:alcohol dehydrogenase class IV